MWASRQRASTARREDDPVPGSGGVAVEELPYAGDAPHRARHGADLGPQEETALAESYDRQVRIGRRRAYAEPDDTEPGLAEQWDDDADRPAESWDGPSDGGSWPSDEPDAQRWDGRSRDEAGRPAGVELTRARLLSFTPYQPKRDRLCTDTASLLRPLVRAGIIDTWATDHSYPSHRAWKLLPSRLAMPRQLPLDGYVEPDGGITLLPLPEAYDEPPLCMLDWVIDWTSAGRLDSGWWTTAVHVTASAGLPPTGTVRP
ncbi:hypothetical protein [Catellatospora citrea]|uniref:Uncharacterized protein n=1 Tax=Catellatospora citrea TaxID=53366 RepID=A0A8J3KL53_9ACTN|nr:hypothetical protein [Catellatospora citrea]RKE10327.1 hypothetical protein C8E86_5222 [Catellatospora citrea]GIF99168.1 hypothetical protein Cci01nite_42620 [Catellatospora citrea]